MPDCHKDEFEKKITALRADSSYESDVCFAIGSAWTENAADLRKCMHLADEAMYADKKEFYALHPDKVRK